MKIGKASRFFNIDMYMGSPNYRLQIIAYYECAGTEFPVCNSIVKWLLLGAGMYRGANQKKDNTEEVAE